MKHQAPWCPGCDQPTHQIRHDHTCAWCDTDLTPSIKDQQRSIDAVHVASIFASHPTPLTKAPT